MRSSRSGLQTFHSCRSQQQQPDFPPQVGSCGVCGPQKGREGAEERHSAVSLQPFPWLAGWLAGSSAGILVPQGLPSLQT